jgi:hypothetical protein
MHALAERQREQLWRLQALQKRLTGLEEEQPKPTRKLGIALVGCGWFGLRAHLPALTKLEQSTASTLGVRLVAICSRTQASLAKAAKRIDHTVAHYTSLAGVLADSDVDVVDLVLPIAAMPAAVEACLAAGKHVLSEKPAAASPIIASRLWQQYSSYAQQSSGAAHSRCHSPAAPAWCILENWCRYGYSLCLLLSLGRVPCLSPPSLPVLLCCP